MPTEATIDINAILKPIPGGNPAGKDIQDSKEFDILKEARREEEVLSQGEWKREVKIADWQKVIQVAVKILSNESKDLGVAAWMTEGLVKRHGFAGLRDGLKVLRELHTQFWASLYPMIEDGDLEIRTGRLNVLNKLLPPAVWTIPLVVETGGGSSYAYWQYKESLEVENLRRGAASDADKRARLAEALKENKLEGEKFDKAVAATPLAHCSTLLEQSTQCIQELEEFSRVLDEKYGEEAPSLRLIKEAVSECQSLMDSLVKAKGGVGVPSNQLNPVGKQTAEVVMSGASIPSAGNGSGKDRAWALRQLAEIAEFFQRTEPHSPIAYLVQRAARWGQMPLDEWLQEVIKNPGVLGEVRETLGIKSEKK